MAWSRDASWTSFDGRWKAGPYYPGQWTHLVVTWKGAAVRTYINGQFRNEHTLRCGTVAQYPHYAPMLTMQGSNLYDELWVYKRLVSDAEVANCYWRYRDPSRLKPLPAAPCRLRYLQGAGVLAARFHMAASPVADKVTRVRLSVLEADGKRRWQGAPAAPTGPLDWLVESVPRLPDGRYTARAEGLDAQGATLGAAQQPFEVKHYAWEGNRIGCGDRVIPPYTPLETTDRHVKPWGRDYTIAPSGLPEQIVSQKQSLLRGPIRLEGVVAGRQAAMAGRRVRITEAAGHKVTFAAHGAVGAIETRVSGFVEYDGWYQVRLELSAAQPVAVDRLDLVCDLWPGADTIYAQWGDRRSRGYFGAVPAGDGVVWTSHMLPSPGRRWGSFLPVVFLGSGDYGLWWLAESNDGWTQNDRTPCVEIERRPDRRTLRLRLVAERTTIHRPRAITFAFLVTPVKPMPKRWRAFAWDWPEAHYVHDTSGYRYYGDSVDAYALHTPADLKALRQFLLLPRRTNPNYGWWSTRAEALRQGRPLVLYGSTWMLGAGFPEFNTFQPEWHANYNWCRPMPDLTFQGRTNYGGTITWTKPRDLSATGVNFCQSQIDCFIWYHQKLVKQVGLNGTWWDNSSIGQIYDFAPGKGKVWKWNVFARRQLTKRLATMCWEAGRPPLWLQNMHVDFSWCQVGWHIENDFYIKRAGQDLIDQLPVDHLRAMTRTKGGLIPQLHSRIPEAGQFVERMDQDKAPVPTLEAASRYKGDAWDVRRAMRSIIGMCLLHDIGERGLPAYKPFYQRDRTRALKAMEQAVGFFSGAPEFVPYWRSRRVVRCDTPGVYASVYVYRKPPGYADRTPHAQRAVVVLVNANNADTVVKGFAVEPRAVGLGAVRRLYDAETRDAIPRLYNKKARRYEWGEWTPGSIMLGRHDYRLLVVE